MVLRLLQRSVDKLSLSYVTQKLVHHRICKAYL